MYKALYVHIPFCKKRCAYCDFTTEALAQDDTRMDAYLLQLIRGVREATRAGQLAQLRTIYVGGGTPTHFGHGRLVELAYTLSLSINLEQIEEYTVEANPESLSPALMRDLYALGVNRLSLGVQSFVDRELAALGRIHDAAEATLAIRQARERFSNISIDLMCGIPEQTQQTWQYTLDRALELEPEHISIYPLQIEEGTPLEKALLDREITVCNEDAQADFLEQAAETLETAGYHRYEVASYAKPGKESRHNSLYWTGASYLGLGRGAASMVNEQDGSRKRWVEGEEPELLTKEEAEAEDLFLAMRMSRGLRVVQLEEAELIVPGAKRVFDELETLGLIKAEDGSLVPTERGWLLGNELYARIWDLAKNRRSCE